MYAVLFDIYTGRSNTKISVFVCQSKDIFILIKTKHPVHVMVFLMITSDGDLIYLPTWPQIQRRALHQVSG